MIEDVPNLDLDEREEVCSRPECNLVHWKPAGDAACEFADCPQ